MTTPNRTELLEAALKAYNEHRTEGLPTGLNDVTRIEGTTFHRQLSAIVDKMVEMIGGKHEPPYYVAAEKMPVEADANNDGYILAWHCRQHCFICVSWDDVGFARNEFPYWTPMLPTPPMSPFDKAIAHFNARIEGETTKPTRDMFLEFWRTAQEEAKK